LGRFVTRHDRCEPGSLVHPPRVLACALVSLPFLVAACGDPSVSGPSPGTGAGPTSSPGGGDASSAPTGPGVDAGHPDVDGGVPGVDSSLPASPDATVADAGDDSAVSGAALITRLLDLTKTCPPSAVVSTHSYSGNNGAQVDVCKLNGAVYYTAKMAIDCDGRTTPHCPGSGADKDCCYYNDTSFHAPNGDPLAAEYDPYVVLPLDFTYPGLDQTHGGNVIAVLYKGQLEWAVFGDQGPTDKIGEASFRTAANLGINSSPASGGVDGDVTYVVFVGDGTQPKDMESTTEVQALGAKLAQALLANNP
jgi:hypothetical protein